MVTWKVQIDGGTEWHIDPERHPELVIGRSSACDIPLPANDTRLSREHVKLKWVDSSLLVEALGKLSIKVNNQDLYQGQTVTVTEPSELHIGGNVFKLAPLSAERADGLCLEIRETNRKRARIVPLTGNCVTIGRESATIIVSGAGVSALHAIIKRNENGEWIIYDNNSTNGLWKRSRDRLQPRRIKQEKLAVGDSIALGDVTIRVTTKPAGVSRRKHIIIGACAAVLIGFLLWPSGAPQKVVHPTDPKAELIGALQTQDMGAAEVALTMLAHKADKGNDRLISELLGLFRVVHEISGCISTAERTLAGALSALQENPLRSSVGASQGSEKLALVSPRAAECRSRLRALPSDLSAQPVVREIVRRLDEAEKKARSLEKDFSHLSQIYSLTNVYGGRQKDHKFFHQYAEYCDAIATISFSSLARPMREIGDFKESVAHAKMDLLDKVLSLEVTEKQMGNLASSTMERNQPGADLAPEWRRFVEEELALLKQLQKWREALFRVKDSKGDRIRRLHGLREMLEFDDHIWGDQRDRVRQALSKALNAAMESLSADVEAVRIRLEKITGSHQWEIADVKYWIGEMAAVGKLIDENLLNASQQIGSRDGKTLNALWLAAWNRMVEAAEAYVAEAAEGIYSYEQRRRAYLVAQEIITKLESLPRPLNYRPERFEKVRRAWEKMSLER